MSGSGWLALGLAAFAGAAPGRSLVGGYEQRLFLGVFAAGLAFEGLWYWRHGTDALC